jgi:hypothetical protein
MAPMHCEYARSHYAGIAAVIARSEATKQSSLFASGLLRYARNDEKNPEVTT